MKGNSGASLDFQGDYVLKTCPQAREQVEWFQKAGDLGLSPGFRLPSVELVDERRYRIEYIAGFSATMLNSVSEFKKLISLVETWSSKPATSTADWNSYLRRLERHVVESRSSIMSEAYRLVAQSEFPSSFCHGDLTLENVLVTGEGEMILIDPNYSPELFQSWVLDMGKLLQSTHSDYHRVFNSSPGVDPAPHLKHLKHHLTSKGVLKISLVSELSHIMRLRRYRPKSEYWVVDKIILSLMKEIQNFPEKT